MRLALILWLCFGAGSVAAQVWQFRSGDDGSFFRASVSQEAGVEMSLVCGERSPRGLSPEVTGNMEPDITAPGRVKLYLGETAIGPPEYYPDIRDDVELVAGRSAYPLRALEYNELFGTWEADLEADHPIFAAMAEAPEFELRSRVGYVPGTTAGFAPSFKQFGAFCSSMFAVIGHPWPGSDGEAGAMKAAAEASILSGCNGQAAREEGYLLTGNIDGDGQEDIIVDWSKVECQTSYPRPFCGASTCSANVFLSSAYIRAGRPEELLAQGVRLVPLTNGNEAVAVGGSLSACVERGPGCEFLYWWDGETLRRLTP